ncbi:MAG: AraC family transcriptional regulator ligand-binding domain-containing protein [Novosphingobium sp.]|uniref:AraC family transcriptional regulator n=1 Tax=Novosphingobium sp. TaxID=1874826 RepID=UPI0022BC33E3|nr:AraC family transcriptional regulator [Novosphingobium sp.]MCZ8061282.1 AraC family transcriptional regulator ligand-binding domain-containing protein [Novosphingobium sp.]
MTLADNPLTSSGTVPRQSVVASMALGLIDFAADRGADRTALLKPVGLDGRTEEINRRVPLDRYAAMFRLAARQCDDPALAVHFAEATNFADLSIVGLLGYASETMRDALDQLNRFGRLVTDIAVTGPARFVLTREADGLWLTDHRIDDPLFPELTESTFVRMVVGTRQFGDTPYASLAEVTHQDHGQGAELARALGVPVRFGAARNAMRVSEAWQTHRIALYPRYAFALFCAHADTLLAELDAARSVAGQVERAVLPVLHTGTVTAEGVARQLGLSGQGLYRALRAEGTTFEDLLADLRHRFARGYLEQGRASLNEIAYLLGYSDVSAFSRAFKRREGVAPGPWRPAHPNN